MDLSEFPCLSDCFSGGSSGTALVEPGMDAVGAAPAAGVSGVVAGSESSGDRRREVIAFGKAVATGGEKMIEKQFASSKGNDPKKRSADACLPREGPSSKLRKVTKDVSSVDGNLRTSTEREKILFQPFQCAFGGRASDCAGLLEKFRMEGEEEDDQFDASERSDWYQKHARAVATSEKFVNRLVNSQAAELRLVKAELERANAKLAAAKGGVDLPGEVTTWRRRYDNEKKVSLAAQKEVEDLTKKMALEAERVKKRQELEADSYEKSKELLRKRYDRAVARHNDVLATCNSRAEKMRSFVEDQIVVRQSKYGVNQIMGVLEAVRVWKNEGIVIPESKVKHLEKDLAARSEAAGLVIPVKMEDKDLAVIPSFDFSVPLDPVLPSLTKGLEEAVQARVAKEEARRREDAARRRPSERGSGARQSVGREGAARQ